MSRCFLLVLIAMILAATAHAAPGDLDITFGNGKGWVSTGFQQAGQPSSAHSMIQQSDGKLVAAGYSRNGRNDDDFALARYNPDGSLDPGFGVGGKVVTDIDSRSGDIAYAVIQQADGKLVAAGSSYNSPLTCFALARYSADGELDTAFGKGGKVVKGFCGASIQSLIQQADGKLVVAGASQVGSYEDFSVARYNANGTLDTGFGTGGKVSTDINSREDYAYSVIQQADGKLVVAGHSDNGSNDDFSLVRYNIDGSLDTAFGAGGKVITAVGSRYDYAYSVIQQADGKLVVAGYAGNGSNSDVALVRYNTDGTLDSGFGVNGKVTTAIGAGNDEAYSIIQKADGKLLVVGRAYGVSNYDVTLIGYNTDGSLDTLFGTGGKVVTAIGSSNDWAYSVVEQTDGNLVIAGAARGNIYDNFALVRYSHDGILDFIFGTGGKVVSVLHASRDQARSVIQQADGRLVVAGYAGNGSANAFAISRYNQDASLDTNFGVGGKVSTVIGDTCESYAVIQQADGRLLAAGASYNGSDWDFALASYNADGSMNTGFGTDGSVATGIGDGNDMAYSIIQQADGKLVAAGSAWIYDENLYGYSYSQDFALVRYNADGTSDTSFGMGGKVTTGFAGGGGYSLNDDYAYSLIQQADGKLVIAGYSLNYDSYTSHFALVRYNEDGSLDSGFGTNGKLITEIGAGSEAYSVIQQADGKLVVAGVSDDGIQSDITLVRYNPDGTLDSTFNTTGIATTNLIDSDSMGLMSQDGAYSVTQQADGKLVAAGSSSYWDNYYKHDFALVRYNTDGSLDATFNLTGKTAVNPGGFGYQGLAYSVIQQHDGNLVVAGYSEGMPTGTEFVVMRFAGDQTDTDGDSVLDDSDAFPLDPAEWMDTDGDGHGNNADLDDDNDGIPDYIDADPLNPAISTENILPLSGQYNGSLIKETSGIQ